MQCDRLHNAREYQTWTLSNNNNCNKKRRICFSVYSQIQLQTKKKNRMKRLKSAFRNSMTKPFSFEVKSFFMLFFLFYSILLTKYVIFISTYSGFIVSFYFYLFHLFIQSVPHHFVSSIGLRCTVQYALCMYTKRFQIEN